MTWWKVWTAPRAEALPDGSVVFRPERSVLLFLAFLTCLFAASTVTKPQVGAWGTVLGAVLTILVAFLFQSVAGRTWTVGLDGLVARNPFGRRWDRAIRWSEVSGVRTTSSMAKAMVFTTWTFTARRDASTRIRVDRNRFMPTAQKAFVDAVSARLVLVGKGHLAAKLRRDLTWRELRDRRRQRRARKVAAA